MHMTFVLHFAWHQYSNNANRWMTFMSIPYKTMRSRFRMIIIIIYGPWSLWCSVATLALGSWPRQGLARSQAKREAQEWRKVWGNEPSHAQRSFHFGSWSLGGFLNVQRVIIRVKTQWFEEFFIPLESYWNLDV